MLFVIFPYEIYKIRIPKESSKREIKCGAGLV
jgi:hypothetical protein